MASQTRLFVGGIPGGTSGDALRDLFTQFGDVVTCELKSKPSDPDNQFAFVTLAANQREVESCIHHFSEVSWNGSQLHVTRARESFLERLQKERQQAQLKKPVEEVAWKVQDNFDGKFRIKTSEVSNLNIKKPEYVQSNGHQNVRNEDRASNKKNAFSKINNFNSYSQASENFSNGDECIPKKEKFLDDKKMSADHKRLESMRKMRKEFNEKKLQIKSGLAGVDKACNKRIKFDDGEPIDQTDNARPETNEKRNGKTLFDDDDDDGDYDVNFQIKEQFEGKKGQKTLALQSRFKSDKRFTLDERFVEDEDEGAEEKAETAEEVEVLGEGEKARQLSILQNVLGVAIKSAHTQPEAVADNKRMRPKLGMLRFDPSQPDHAKFLAPADNTKKDTETTKKKKKRKEEPAPEPKREVEKVEASKEQFYKVSDTLKEAIAQPSTFSLRNLFTKNHTQDEDETDKVQDTGYTPLPAAKKDKVKNPFDKISKNPFKYDSSDSEAEPEGDKTEPAQEAPAGENVKAVWREKLFFSKFDNRFKEGLAFFNNTESSGNKERRELKFLVKKRLYNSARKDHMFQKKIGGKRKTINKNRRQKR